MQTCQPLSNFLLGLHRKLDTADFSGHEAYNFPLEASCKDVGTHPRKNTFVLVNNIFALNKETSLGIEQSNAASPLSMNHLDRLIKYDAFESFVA